MADVTAMGSGSVPLLVRVGEILGQDIRTQADVVRMVRVGLPPEAFNCLARRVRAGATMVAPRSTVRRRLRERQRFTTAESERMIRIARVYALAMDAFGEEGEAQSWLGTRAAYLPGERDISPSELSVMDAGARLLEALLLRTAHGVF